MKPRRQISSGFTRPSTAICHKCPWVSHSRPTSSSPRTLSTSTQKPSPPHPRSAAYTHLPSRRLISLSGPDSTHFLQGAITQNLTPVSSRTKRAGLYAAFLNAQGRLLNDVFVYPDTVGLGAGRYAGQEDAWVIEVDAKEVERLAKHTKKYKLRAKFDIRVLEVGERRVWSVWDERKGPGSEEGWTKHSLQGTVSSNIVSEGAESASELGCEDLRAPGMGRRLLLPSDQRPQLDLEETDETAYTIRRYLKGIAEGQDELTREHSLPQESNIDFMGGIDYRKGCYVGQELTIRTHHTGVVRKRILPVMLYAKDGAEPTSLDYIPGLDLNVENIPKDTGIGRVEKRGRSAGKFLTGIGNIGLGLCRLEVMTDVQVQGEPGGYRYGDEFKLEWQLEGRDAEVLKIKAFVPAWHLT